MFQFKQRSHSPAVDTPVRRKESISRRPQHLNYAQGTEALSPKTTAGYEAEQAALSPNVQRKAHGSAQTDVHQAAQQGISGSGSALPHLESIQRSFGRHNVSGITAHTGSMAASACQDIGAQAYATGNSVAFGSSPDLHTAAHEAAHVVQQRAGVSLKGGVGVAGDSYEQHADRVADQVVQGKSAESLLDKFAGPSPQQSSAIQRKETAPETTDPIAELGNTLWRDFPNGVNVSLYDPYDRELVNQGTTWGKTYNAIGSKSSLAAGSLKLGVGIPVESSLEKNISALEKSLAEVASKATNKPEGVTGAGPAKIATLALFSHGTNDWLGLGDSLTTSNIPTVVSKISSALTNDVNVVIYGCSVSRGENEENSWKNTTTSDGGADSFAATFRDALVDEGKDESSVWGHTEVGHTSRNFTLRGFSAADGKGSDGFSYLNHYVWNYNTDGLSGVEAAVKAQGYEIPNAAKFKKIVDYYTKGWIYGRYSSSMRNLEYNGRHLAEAAPLFPSEVGKLIKDYALKTWPEKEAEIAKKAISRLKLKKSASPEATH
jgi:hypothetical protein